MTRLQGGLLHSFCVWCMWTGFNHWSIIRWGFTRKHSWILFGAVYGTIQFIFHLNVSAVDVTVENVQIRSSCNHAVIHFSLMVLPPEFMVSEWLTLSFEFLQIQYNVVNEMQWYGLKPRWNETCDKINLNSFTQIKKIPLSIGRNKRKLAPNPGRLPFT